MKQFKASSCSVGFNLMQSKIIKDKLGLEKWGKIKGILEKKQLAWSVDSA